MSFFEAMTKEQIILDMDAKVLEQFPEINIGELDRILTLLTKQGHIKISDTEHGKAYIRIQNRQRTLLQKLIY